MIGIDTNVLVRFITADDAEQSMLASKYLDHNCSQEQPGYINRIVQCELVWVLSRAYKYKRIQIASVLEMLFRTRQFFIEDHEASLVALRQYRLGKADYADALIAYSNRAAGCRVTATFDSKASKLDVFEAIG